MIRPERAAHKTRAKGAVDPLPGHLEVVQGGWQYERDGRIYRGVNPAGDFVFDVDAALPWSRSFLRIDVSLACCREEFARLATGPHVALAKVVCRDLNLARLGIQFSRIDQELESTSGKRAPTNGTKGSLLGGLLPWKRASKRKKKSD